MFFNVKRSVLWMWLKISAAVLQMNECNSMGLKLVQRPVKYNKL